MLKKNSIKTIKINNCHVHHTNTCIANTNPGNTLCTKYFVKFSLLLYLKVYQMYTVLTMPDGIKK